MGKRYVVQYEPVKSNPSSRFYRGFVKIGGFKIEVIPSDPPFIKIGRRVYHVKGEPDKEGRSWVRYIEIGE